MEVVAEVQAFAERVTPSPNDAVEAKEACGKEACGKEACSKEACSKENQTKEVMIGLLCST